MNMFDKIKSDAFKDEMQKISSHRDVTNAAIMKRFNLTSAPKDSVSLSNLGADDYDRAELTMDLEGEHNISIPDSDLNTVGDVHHMIKKRLGDYSSYRKGSTPLESKLNVLQKKYPKESQIPNIHSAKGGVFGAATGGLLGSVVPLGMMGRSIAKKDFRSAAKSGLKAFGYGAAGTVGGAVLGSGIGYQTGLNKQNKTEYGIDAKPLTDQISVLRKKYQIVD
jgi:acyl carrier protein